MIRSTLTVMWACSASSMAQSSIDAMHKYAWSENCGWLNFRDAGAPAGAQGVRVHSTFLSGFAWGENIGFVNFGDGSPANGVTYANTTGADSGVNIAANGDLFGLAWGENVGWINFDTRASLSSFGQQARLDSAAGRFRGYAWGENIGWVNLDDAEHYVGIEPGCAADIDGDGDVDGDDFFGYLDLFVAGDARADIDGDGDRDADDFFAYLDLFAQGC
ncbi:MAG: hypothetical protein H6811_02970 [Phycisphaeraceae bacterium]|nr:hypothetical protein [Phycisphaeraceae bacterium]